MARMLREFLIQDFDEDHREQLFAVTVPLLGKFGVVGCDLQFWLISFILLSAECFLNCLFALLIYKFIVPYQKSTRAYLLGYGLVLPAILYSPFVLLEMIPVKNMAFLLCMVGGTATLVIFRCVEAMHGTLPGFSQSSLGSFMLYYASALQFQMDESTGVVVRITRQRLVSKILTFGGVFVRTSLLYSVLMPFGYKLFPTPPIKNLAQFFHWANIANNFLLASLTSLVLESGGVGLGILTSFLSGFDVIDFNDSPLTKSESPSDFWSKRWNKITQSGLRRGVFLPLVTSGFSRTVAAFGTFVVSGVLHEYVLLIMKARSGRPNNPAQTPFEPNYGNHLYFFAWCGAVTWLEKLIQRTTPIIWMKKHLPPSIRTALVLLTVLPIAHLFMDEYIKSSFYNDLALGFVKIKYLGN